MRRGRDSNPRYPFEVYTLSRRAPSTTRTPLRKKWGKCRKLNDIGAFILKTIQVNPTLQGFEEISGLEFSSCTDQA
jgi:hypothetical protein